MRIHKSYIALGLVIAFALFFELAAHADQMNESSKITFSAPIEIPGKVLPAGTYVFQQAEPDTDPNLIQIYNADGSELYATVPTASADRTDATGDTAITLAEPGSGNPDMLVKWFYAGSLTGHEFLYTQQQEQSIARGRQETFVGDHISHNAHAAGD